MRQQGDTTFIAMLNEVRLGNLSKDSILLLNSRKEEFHTIPVNAVYIFAENHLKDTLNKEKLNAIHFMDISITASDKIPSDITKASLEKALNLPQTETGGLPRVLVLRKTARVMITNNIDTEDRLINGQMGAIFDFKYSSNSEVEIIYVRLDDNNSGLKKMRFKMV